MENQKNNSIIEKLDKVPSSEDSIEELYTIFNSLKNYALPLIKVNIEPGAFIIRQRINEEGAEFSYIHELSYPPTQFTKYGRANIPYHPMFYGCTFGMEQTNVEPRILTLLETSEFAQDTDTIGIQRSTCSRWNVIDSLQLLALPFSNSYSSPIDEIKQIQDEWNKEIGKVNINKKALDITIYMSKEIAKKAIADSDYFKIAHFVYFLLYLNENTKDYDGIIFPSVAANGDGYNVAIKPEVVDKKLQFDVAALCYLVKNKEKEHLDIISLSTEHDEYGYLSFKKEDNYNEETYKEFIFVN